MEINQECMMLDLAEGALLKLAGDLCGKENEKSSPSSIFLDCFEGDEGTILSPLPFKFGIFVNIACFSSECSPGPFVLLNLLIINNSFIRRNIP